MSAHSETLEIVRKPAWVQGGGQVAGQWELGRYKAQKRSPTLKNTSMHKTPNTAPSKDEYFYTVLRAVCVLEHYRNQWIIAILQKNLTN